MSFTVFFYIMLQVTLLQSHWDLTLAGERVNATESPRFSHELMIPAPHSNTKHSLWPSVIADTGLMRPCRLA